MAKKKSASKGAKVLYTRYKAEGREAKNRELKIMRHLKNHPNDKQAENALAKKPVHRAKPSKIKKKVIHNYGIQEVGSGVFAYVSNEVYKPGHPALQLLKQKQYSEAGKFRNAAIMSDEFKAAFNV